MNKLAIIFDEDSEVLGVPPSMLFNNELDASEHLLDYDPISDIKISPDDKFFSFKTNSWSGTGKAIWLKDKTV